MAEGEPLISVMGHDLAEFCEDLFNTFNVEVPTRRSRRKINFDDPQACYTTLKTFWDNIDTVMQCVYNGLETSKEMAIDAAILAAETDRHHGDVVHEATEILLLDVAMPPARFNITYSEPTLLKDAASLRSPFGYKEDSQRVWDLQLPRALQRTFPAEFMSDSMTHNETATYYVVQANGGGKTHSIVELAKKMFVYYINVSNHSTPGISPVVTLWHALLPEARELFEADRGQELDAARQAFRLLIATHSRLLLAFRNAFPRENACEAWFNFSTSKLGQSMLVCLFAYAFEAILDNIENPGADTIVALDDAGDLLTRGGIWRGSKEIGQDFYKDPEDYHVRKRRSGLPPNLYTTMCDEARGVASYLVVCSSNYHVTQHTWVDPEAVEKAENAGKAPPPRASDQFFVLSKVELSPAHVASMLHDISKKRANMGGLRDLDRLFARDGFLSLAQFLSGSPLWLSMFMASVRKHIGEMKQLEPAAQQRHAIEHAIGPLVRAAATMVVRPESWGTAQRMNSMLGLEWCHRAALASFFGALTNMTHLIPLAHRHQLASEHLACIAPLEDPGRSSPYGLLDPDVLRDFVGLTIRPNADGPVRMGLMQLMYKETHPKALADARRHEARRKGRGTKAERAAAATAATAALARQEEADRKGARTMPSTMLEVLVHQLFVNGTLVSVSNRGPDLRDFFVAISVIQAMADTIFEGRNAADIVLNLPTVRLSDLLTRLGIKDAATIGETSLMNVCPATHIARAVEPPSEPLLNTLINARVGYFGGDHSTRPALILPAMHNGARKLVCFDFVGTGGSAAPDASEIAQKFTANIIRVSDQYGYARKNTKIRTMTSGPRFPELSSRAAKKENVKIRRMGENPAHPGVVAVVYNFGPEPIAEASLVRAPFVPEHFFLPPLATWDFARYGLNAQGAMPTNYRLLMAAERNAMAQDATSLAYYDAGE